MATRISERDRCGQENLGEIGVGRRISERWVWTAGSVGAVWMKNVGEEGLGVGERYVWPGSVGVVWVKSVGEEGLGERYMCGQEAWVEYG